MVVEAARIKRNSEQKGSGILLIDAQAPVKDADSGQRVPQFDLPRGA
jgi:hypothetical protein